MIALEKRGFYGNSSDSHYPEGSWRQIAKGCEFTLANSGLTTAEQVAGLATQKKPRAVSITRKVNKNLKEI